MKHLSDDTVAKLEAVIKANENVPPEQFDMTNWRNGCGTAGCAFGNFVASANIDGMVLDDQGLFYNNPVTGSCEGGYMAASGYLGITYMQADYLFNPYRYVSNQSQYHLITKERVIGRIRYFIKSDGKTA